VLVHGFHTDVTSAEQEFIPTILKRLYWTGTPVLDTKRDDDYQNHAHVVGIEWPGDQKISGVAQVLNYLYFFPEDEEHALESGVPIGEFFQSLKQNANANRTVSVIAHSLGNMTANSAISRIPAHTVDKYIMYDAALTSEAFSPNFAPDTDQLQHAQFLGYPAVGGSADVRWQTDWSAMLNNSDPFAALDLLNWCSAVTPGNSVRPRYVLRWGQTRPPAGIADEVNPTAITTGPCNVPSDTPQRGPWLGFFAQNTGKTKMFNGFNPTDNVLGLAWKALQIYQKPNFGPKALQIA